MKLIVLTTLFVLFLNADSFITKYEYGEYLYDNPRGIGCNRCHGEDAGGKLIATYTKNDKAKTKVELKGSNIQNISLQKLQKALRKPPTVMPKYNLTQREIEALHIFLSKVGE